MSARVSGNQHTLENIKIASRQTRQTLMMARVVVVMMTMLEEEEVEEEEEKLVVVSAKLMSRGCCSPDLAINIPVKALKLHHAEAARGSFPPRRSRLFDHRSRFSNVGFPFEDPFLKERMQLSTFNSHRGCLSVMSG